MRKQYVRWREHGSPGWLLVYTLGGMGRFGHADGELLARKGDLVLLMPETRNDYGLENTLRRWDLLWAYFFPRKEWLSLLKWPQIAPGLLYLHLSNPTERAGITRQLHETHRLNSGPRRLREFFAVNAFEKALLLCDGANPNSERPFTDPRVEQAKDYLCENLAHPITLTLLARHCGLSPSRLSHLFREQVGQTPRQFLELHRLTQASQLLALTQQPICAIAAEVGFPDLFHFSKRFRRHFRVSPRGYRQQLQGGTG